MKYLSHLAFFASLWLGFGHCAQSQISCGTPELSSLEKSELAFTLTKNYKKLRRSSYAISVNVVIVQPDLDQSSFGNEEINQLMTRVNLYFKNIGLQFHLFNCLIQHVHSSKYLNFKTSDELELRQQYDRRDAINLYFVKSITREDGAILNGYSNLPSLNAGSNSIIFSYQDNNPEDFRTLIDKTLLHEFGHYFGLLHTFQDSNNKDISKRELVSRGSIANCGFTGDELCDTPSDPYDRLKSISAYNCTEPYPEELLDAAGDTYISFFANIMSYHLRCGDSFTQQQYQRMQASLGIRLSPNSEYQIAIPEPNFVAIKPFEQKVFCAGETIILHLDKSGLFKDNNTFSAEMSNGEGENFQNIPSIVYSDSLQIKLPNSTPQGFNYRFRVVASSPQTTSFPTGGIQVNTDGEINLSSTEKSINLGDYAKLTIKMIGTGPWDFSLSNGSVYKNVFSPELSVLVSPNTKTKYSITAASNLCKTKVDTSILELDVVQPNIRISISFDTSLCKAELIRVPVSGLSQTSLGMYQVELKNKEHVFFIAPTLSALTMNFSLPDEIPGDTEYSMRILGDGLGDYSLPRIVQIKESPLQPKIISPVNYCFGAVASKLLADGLNLRWYYEETGFLHQPKLIPETQKEGTHYYYVSQTLTNGCESKRSKIEVNIKSEVSATISGNNTIITGDSTLINIAFTGEAPWNIQLEDGFEFTSFAPNVNYYVDPLESTTFSIKQVNNACGPGKVLGEASIIVRLPLAVKDVLNETISVYPIPAWLYVDIETSLFQNGMVNLNLTNVLGLTIAKDLIDLRNGKTRWRLPNLPSGLYLLHFKNEDISITKKLVLK
jgi:hypothetical protein